MAKNKVVDENNKFKNTNSELEKNNTQLSTMISNLNNEKKDLEKKISEMMPTFEYFTKNFKKIWVWIG